ncbi:MAG: NAD+ synthase [Bacteroidetes bacterium]|nr:NAD+ synthase [Bacteroidota bacterium]
MRIALAQLNFQIGAFDSNTQQIISAINTAKEQKADLVVFPELAISGYPPQDFLEFDSFIYKCLKSLTKISEHCDTIAAIVGTPYVNPNTGGKKLYNSACFIYDKEIKQVVHKTLLPEYDIFDECRYFEPNFNFECIDFKGYKIALSICEDLWNIYTPYYSRNPMDELIKQSPDLMINIAASPFSYAHDDERELVLKRNVDRYKIPLVYVNHIGAQTEILYDGASKAISTNGKIIKQLALFQEEISTIELSDLQKEVQKETVKHPEKYHLIHDGLIMGIKDYFSKLNFKKAIIGLSGGIDSALTLVLLQRALGAENVKAMLLPSMFSSDHSIKDAVDLALKLEVSYDIISIKSLYESFEKSLNPYFEGTSFDVAEENLQSRIRAVLLMAMSNKFGYILVNTSNKSELAVGYGTLYGDMCGGLSVLGDLYKTEVIKLSKFINREEEIIPLNILTKPPSAELKPDQKDSDSLPDYSILDKILINYIEKRKGFEELTTMGFDPVVVRKILNLVNNNEHKRYQAPPVLRVSDKAFGIGRRIPIVASYSI